MDAASTVLNQLRILGPVDAVCRCCSEDSLELPSIMHRLLCCTLGEKGIGKTTISPLYYRGTRFHSIIKGLMAQGYPSCRKQ
ncbi:peptidyl-prolyl cis-trans isomerase G-like isoform X1 [Sorghum bicolor]|uniref:peptidyl-prolyl cis-trans isomerase G-like isoform X1 n=1 Tax=Sorghum bicolor TaxID=4558 RepID=UPI000B42588E|nr:peptidyl-prolyl cis-trans isomerase G-like isoform X1 [Sorghum bicolor]|eukprot:XP_021304423.1 peptidyl-prolyl cis-trans isomerase G-like isoform X1 [Sorghum bicolor]